LTDELPPQRGNPALELEERVRDLLVRMGLQEVITYRMTTPEMEARRLAPATPPVDRPHLRLANPINQERAVMRQSLVASVLEIVERNARIRERIALFEIGEVFLASEGGSLPDERSRLVIAMTGVRSLPTWQGGQAAPMDFFDLKGVVESLLSALHVEARYEPGSHPSFHPGKCAYVLVGDRRLGTLGELHPEVAARYDLSGALDEQAPILAGSFSMEVLLEATPGRYESEPVPVYPPVFEDLALVVADDVPADRVAFLIRQTGGATVSDVHLFDVYRGDQLAAGQKSLAYRVTYQAPDKTLSDSEVARLRRKIVGRLERELGAQLRS
jgi:phenylalanyl-tRNA synthetase beta chain